MAYLFYAAMHRALVQIKPAVDWEDENVDTHYKVSNNRIYAGKISLAFYTFSAPG